MKKGGNKILLENKKPGTSGWSLERPALEREIEGYASKNSINCGEPISFYVNTKSKEYSLTIIRMGWYNGLGARQIENTIILKGNNQKIPLPHPETGLVECDWVVDHELQTESSWTSGVYLAKLEELDSNTQSYILFVVRDDNYQNDILFQLPVTTYQAYNFWGGKNLYEFGSGSLAEWGTVNGNPATKVSFNRPYVRSNNPKAAYGMGAGDFFTNTRPVTTHKYPISSAGWDYNMVRWLEKNGYDLSYITSIDTHRRIDLHEKTKIFLSHGHDEYWTHEMRQNITAVRDKGTNLAFVSSNTMFWQIRLEEGSFDKKENRTIVCYKEKELDPVKGKKSTVNFRDNPEQGSEASLIGINYILDPVVGDITITNASHWAFKNSGVKNGDILKGLLGYEIDAIASNSPSNIEVLTTTICQSRDKSDYPGIIKYIMTKIFKISIQPLEKKLKVPRKLSVTLVVLIVLLGLLLLWQVFLKFGALILIIVGISAMLLFSLWFIKIINSGKVTSNMTIYKAQSNAWVFATGSMQWVWGLDDYNSPVLRKSFKSKKVEVIMKNILERMLGE